MCAMVLSSRVISDQPTRSSGTDNTVHLFYSVFRLLYRREVELKREGEKEKEGERQREGEREREKERKKKVR